MTVLAPEVEAEAFDLSEAISLEESVMDDDGTVTIHALRPCVGKGKGRHVYEAEMLKEHAHLFGGGDDGPGWRMYTDHLSEQARRALGGLPRPLAHLGGRVVESWWDDDVPAEPDKGYGQGAVMARVRPAGLAKKLIEEDPTLVEASINAKATSVKPVVREGKRAWLVEGIEDHGSIDWVTEGGAGGRVASLIESAYHTQEDVEMALFESLTDEELVRHLREQRPELIEGLAAEAPEKPEKPKTPEKPEQPERQEGSVSPAELLQEAVKSDEGREFLDSFIATRVQEAVSYQGDLLRAEASADADRRIQLRDFRDAAHQLIEGARLPDSWSADLKRRFDITEDGPTPQLNQLDDIDEESGEVTKAAAEKLTEAVQAEIAHQRELLAEANPTRVRRQGPARDSLQETPEKPDEGGEGGEGGDGGTPKPRSGGSLWERTLEEAGVDPSDAYSE